jgi:hypothetical protein
MTTEEALKQYNKIARRIFSYKNQRWIVQHVRFKSSTLEKEMKRVIAKKSEGNGEERMFDRNAERGRGAA